MYTAGALQAASLSIVSSDPISDGMRDMLGKNHSLLN